MRKLASKPFESRYDIVDDTMYIYGKINGKWVKGFECNPACLPVIKANDNLLCENVVLQPVKLKEQSV